VLPRIVWRSLLARRARVVLGLLAVTLGVAVTTALATLALQVGDDLARSLRAAGPNFVVLPAGERLPLDLGGAAVEPARAGFALPDSAVARLKRGFWKNAVLEAAPELALAGSVEGRPITIVGTWFDHPVVVEGETWRTGLARLQPHWKLDGRWPRGDAPELVLGQALAARLGAGPGARVSVGSGGRLDSWLVTGVVAAGADDDRKAWAPLSIVQGRAGRDGEIDRIWLSAKVSSKPEKAPPDPSDPAAYERYMCTPYPSVVARDLAAQEPGAEVIPMTEVVAGEAMVVRRLDLLMLLLALASLAASTLGLLSTTTATVVERGVELGLLRSIGASSSQIAFLLFAETALVSLAGGVLGWTIGTASAAAIRGQTFGGGAASFPALLLPLALVLSLVVAVIGTVGPLRMALRLDPAAVLRG
jgi:putative ABC transport system permease protein